MSDFVGMMPVVVVALMAATGATLIAGVLTMGRGGDFSRRWSNRLMQLRVALQALAVLLAAMFALFLVS